MSDFYTPQAPSEAPSAAPASQYTPQSTFAPDLDRLDRNFRRVNQIESSWPLPKLPDSAKFDLISMEGADDDSLAELLLGLSDDITRAGPEEPPSDPFLEQEQTPMSALDTSRVILASVSSQRPPRRTSEDAVRQFKLRAIERGMLDQDPRRVDSTWSPEFNRIRGEMAYEDYNDQLRGDRPGAVPVNRAMQLLGDLTSPAGLLSFATDLDLMIDPGAVAREWESWGDKWRAVADADNPLEFAGSFIDAVTGPIDDVAFPILNVGLMLTGIGAVANIGRVGWMGANLARGGGLFARLYGGAAGTGRLARAGQALGRIAGANLDEIARASMTAERLRRGARGIERGSEAFAALSGGTRFASRAGDALAAWRSLRPVAAAKGTVQQGMRLGLVEYAEEAFPGYQGGGPSLSDIPAVGAAADRMYQAGMSPAFLPLELMFAPYNIFAPGTYFRRAGQGIGLVSGAGRGATRALGSAPGRAAVGAVGGAAAGTIAGEDAGDVAQGAAIGAVGAATLPIVGRMLSVERLHQGATGALAGAAAGAMLGDSPEDVALGALAGTGLMAMPASVRRRIYDQAGVNGLDRLIRGVGHTMMRTSFAPIGKDQQVVAGFHRKMQRLLSEDELVQWDTDVQVSGVLPALAKRQSGNTGSDALELAAGTVAFDYTSFAIDWIASAQASVIRGAGAREAGLHMARNKLINQLRPIDIGRPVDDIVDEVAKALAWNEKGGVGSTLGAVNKRKRDLKQRLMADPDRAVALAEEHNKQISDTIGQLYDQRNFPMPPELVVGQPPAHKNLLGDQWAGESMRDRTELYAMHGGWSNFGDHPKFVTAANELRMARLDDLFDAATLKPVVNRRGYKTSPFRNTPKVDRRAAEIDGHLNDLVTAGRVDADKLGDVRFTPLAGAHEAGRVTVMRLDSLSKQDLDELAEQVADIVDTRRLLDEQVLKGWPYMVKASKADATFKASDLSKAQFAEMVDELVKAGANRKTARKLLGFAQHHQLSLNDLDSALTSKADEWAGKDIWENINLGRHAVDDNGQYLTGVDALQHRLKGLRTKALYTAAEIDMDDLGRYYDNVGDRAKAAKVRALKADLEERGYKAVHGTEFLMPEDLAFDVPTFKDLTRRNLNAVTLGNFFDRRHPVEAAIRDDRWRRLAIVNELAGEGTDVAPDSDKVDNALAVLERWLRGEQEVVAAKMRGAHLIPRWRRTLARVDSSFVPIRLDDIGGMGHQNAILQALHVADYEPREAMAIWRATNRFRNTDFKDMGLYAVEAHLRGRSVPAGFLKALSGSRYGDGLFRRGLGQAATGAAVGGVAGVTTAATDATQEDKLKRALMGAGIGAASGAAVGAGVTVADRAFDLVQRAENWQYGYLADGYARLRDSLRFTLSPIFDLSRYTEGLFLAQTAAPARRADGSRLALPVASFKGGLIPVGAVSPTGLRRRLATRIANATQGKASDVAVKSAARAKYENLVDEFNAASKRMGDHDRDAIDSTGRWFRQVGILGFSPTDWMATSYAYLRGEGLDANSAYKAAREMYAYGSRGRSAAELSVNFILFPFSFQKKALGHLGKWLNEDLGRSIVLHDAFKTYEILDQELNLDQYWKDHIPWLQQLQRLNLFAFGISPGRFGGINSQLFEGAGKVAWNAFIPVGANIKDASAGKELQDLGRQLMPVWNDINWMMRNVQESGNVLMSPTHVVSAAQVRNGYEEWYAFKRDFESWANGKGYTMADVLGTGKPWLSEAKGVYLAKQAELRAKYPAWFESQQESLGNIEAENMERKDRQLRVQLGMSTKPDDVQVAQFEEILDKLRTEMELLTGSPSLDNAPPAMFDHILRTSAQFAEENPGWIGLWRKFYQREWGPIEMVMSIQ